MKVVILAGGLGTRLAEETDKIPKPMVKIGRKPIISHIIKSYLKFGFKDIIICSGYKKEVIKKYFKNHKNIHVVDTGLHTQSGARIKLIKKFLGKDEDFFMTYGDGVSDIDIKKLLLFHKKHKKIATLSAVRPLPRFGHLTIINKKVVEFKEKDKVSEGWINGGFFVLNQKIFKYINSNNNCIFERDPLVKLSQDGQLMAYQHDGFWHPMDTLRDKRFLNDLIKKRKAPWL